MITIPDKYSNFEINDEMLKVFKAVYEDRKNCLLLGKAGTGKSVILNMISAIDKRDGINSIFLAPTGIAAINIGGQTIHSFFKLGIHPKKPSQYTLHPDTRNILRHVDRIIIDEISMVRADIYDAMDLLCREAKGNDDYFGGIQLVCVGDLFQIPPIIGKSDVAATYYIDQYGNNPYFFASELYHENKKSFENIIFNKIYRQNDGGYKDILNRIRTGVQTDSDLEVINERLASHTRHKAKFPDSIYLAPYNNIVDGINKSELGKLKSELICFDAAVIGFINTKNFMVSDHIKVKSGAKIMLLVNEKSGAYQNGTFGIFKSVINSDTILVDVDGRDIYVKQCEFKEYKYTAKNGKLSKSLKGSFKQFPFKLAYASSFHKGQGQTFEEGYIDFASNLFADHMAYVALSRFRDMDKIGLKRKLSHSDITVSPYVQEFMRSIE